jgi:Fe(3+) dicitrate transport protein
MFNAGTATVKGLEFSAASDVSLMKLNGSMLSMPVSLAYTYTQAVFDHTFQGAGGDWGSGTINAGDAIPFITPHQLSAQIGLSTSAVHFLVIGRYTGATRVKPGQADMVFPGSGVAYTSFNALDATFFVDATCNVDLNESITVLMSLTNVANSTAIVANLPQGFRPSMPRSGNVGLKIRF